MGTAKQAVEYAKSQIGVSSGRGYWKIVRGYESDADWCAIFDSAILIKTHTNCVYFPNNFAFDRRDMSVIGDRWVDKYELQEGDMVSFDFDGGGEYGGDHVGIVVKRYGRGDYQTVEGNCGKQVKTKHRTVSDDGIIGGIRPYYDPEVFTDVDSSTPHYADIKWMKEKGIAKGYPDGSYRPFNALTRGDAAAFLHRLYNVLK